MTTYLGEKAVGIGTVKATIGVTGDVLHDSTLKGNGNTEPLGVDTEVIATTTQVGNLATTLHAAIEAQAEAIAKTRNDFEVADQKIRADMNEKDSELGHMITEHAEELTTLRGNQASLGDQVSNIESKIPQSASGTNHLITKQQLLDEEMDIRDDLNETSSELQTQITSQASEIAKLKQEVSGLSSLSFEILDELPAVGKEGVIYLVPSGGEAPNLRDEYVWVNGAFEVIGSTQIDLTGYVKFTDYASWDKAGVIKYTSNFGVTVHSTGYIQATTKTKDEYASSENTMFIGKGTLENIKKDIVERAVSDGAVLDGYVKNTDYPDNSGNTAGVLKIKSTNGLYVSNGALHGNPIPATHWETLSSYALVCKGALENIKNDLVKRAITTNDITLTTAEQDAACNWLGAPSWGNLSPTLGSYDERITALEEQGGGASLPDYTGVYGVLRSKNGVLSWDNKAVFNVSTATGAFAIGYDPKATGTYSVALSGSATATHAIALGYNSSASSQYAIMIGDGINKTEKTLRVGFGDRSGDPYDPYASYELLSRDGTIPAERMSTTAGTTGQVLTKTDSGMAWADASGGGDYLPLSGGTLTGGVTFDPSDKTDGFKPILTVAEQAVLKAHWYNNKLNYLQADTKIYFNGGLVTTKNIGDAGERVATLYVKNLYNGDSLTVPTKGGTLARIEDIDAAVGDISTALSAILGE